MKKNVRNVAIVHYNTPELTEALILSIRKFGGKDYKVYVLDNSDKWPLTQPKRGTALWGRGGVKVFNNRKGKIIDFDKELAKYPDRDESIGCSKGCCFGSDKHMMSVQKLWELVPDGFVLADSDILIKDHFDWMFMEDQCCCGYVSTSSGPWKIQRLAPMLCWINVPMCVAGGARYFDPDRAWALHKGHGDRRNFWDTGGAFLDDIKRLKPQCHGKAISRDKILSVMVHYGNGSWAKNDARQQVEWLMKHQALWG